MVLVICPCSSHVDISLPIQFMFVKTTDPHLPPKKKFSTCSARWLLPISTCVRSANVIHFPPPLYHPEPKCVCVSILRRGSGISTLPWRRRRGVPGPGAGSDLPDYGSLLFPTVGHQPADQGFVVVYLCFLFYYRAFLRCHLQVETWQEWHLAGSTGEEFSHSRPSSFPPRFYLALGLTNQQDVAS